MGASTTTVGATSTGRAIAAGCTPATSTTTTRTDACRWSNSVPAWASASSLSVLAIIGVGTTEGGVGIEIAMTGCAARRLRVVLPATDRGAMIFGAGRSADRHGRFRMSVAGRLRRAGGIMDDHLPMRDRPATNDRRTAGPMRNRGHAGMAQRRTAYVPMTFGLEILGGRAAMLARPQTRVRPPLAMPDRPGMRVCRPIEEPRVTPRRHRNA